MLTQWKLKNEIKRLQDIKELILETLHPNNIEYIITRVVTINYRIRKIQKQLESLAG